MIKSPGHGPGVASPSTHERKMNRKIKLTYIIDILDTNLAGTENQLIKMINGLDKRRFELELICFSDAPWLQANKGSLSCTSKVFSIARFKKPGTYLDFARLVKHLRSSRPDIVHTFFPVGNIVGVLAARLAGVGAIISSRRDYGEWMSPRYLLYTRLANRFVTRIIANSNAVKELTIEKEKPGKDKLGVIYNGIDLEFCMDLKCDHSLKKNLNIPDGNFVAGIIANFRPMKHHHTFVKAASEVLKVRKDVTFLLIGRGKLKSEMERAADELKISDNLLFLGAQPEVRPYLSIMDVGVNCSEGEGLSNAVMEYMCAGIPCVVSRAGGNTDLIQDGVTGYTFAIDDYKALSALMLKLFEDGEARARFVAEARRKIEREMSLGVILSKYEDLYYGLVKDQREQEKTRGSW